MWLSLLEAELGGVIGLEYVPVEETLHADWASRNAEQINLLRHFHLDLELAESRPNRVSGSMASHASRSFTSCSRSRM